MNRFLGKDGLTSASANHLANVAKEMYESHECKLNSIRLVSRDYTLAVNGQKYRLENESPKEELFYLLPTLEDIASLKSLIAWLREGIKAKEWECSSLAIDEWFENQVKAGREDLKEPDGGEPINFDSILGAEPVDRQARYYALEARCATLGKYIHPDGHLSAARKAFFDMQKNPTMVLGSGQNAEINTYSSEFSGEEIDLEFFTIQQEYRAAQAEFNALKSELENKLTEAKRNAYKERSDAREQWKLRRDAALLEHTAEVKALKIVIPNALKEIYRSVAAVANIK